MKQRQISEAQRPLPRTGYLPSLDGWRAIAIIAVMMDHDQPWTMFNHSNSIWHENGGWGVWLFFAISGFLVCTRILEDESLCGAFLAKRFYIRRFFRIQPAALVYLAVIALLALLHVVPERTNSLLGALFLYQNYLYHHTDHSGGWYMTGHFWTLSIEEHFYLLLSILLLTFKRYRELVFLCLVIFFYFWSNWAPYHTHLYDPIDSIRYTEFNIQYLLGPALLALLMRRQAFRDFFLKYLDPIVVFTLTLAANQFWVFVLPLARFQWTHYIAYWMIHSGPLFFFACQFWVVSTVLHPRSWTTRFLELAPLRYIGRLSYSIYLWHAIFFLSRYPEVGVRAHWLIFLYTRPWRYVATAAAALASYYLIERPLIRLGHRLAAPATPGHRDLEPTLPAAA